VQTLAQHRTRVRSLRAAGALGHFALSVKIVHQLGCLTFILVVFTNTEIAVNCHYSALFVVISCLNGVPQSVEPSRAFFPVSMFLRHSALRRSSFLCSPSFLIFNSYCLISPMCARSTPLGGRFPRLVLSEIDASTLPFSEAKYELLIFLQKMLATTICGVSLVQTHHRKGLLALAHGSESCLLDKGNRL
jgi:hypothetical protein